MLSREAQNRHTRLLDRLKSNEEHDENSSQKSGWLFGVKFEPRWPFIFTSTAAPRTPNAANASPPKPKRNKKKTKTIKRKKSAVSALFGGGQEEPAETSELLWSSWYQSVTANSSQIAFRVAEIGMEEMERTTAPVGDSDGGESDAESETGLLMDIGKKKKGGGGGGGGTSPESVVSGASSVVGDAGAGGTSGSSVVSF